MKKVVLSMMMSSLLCLSLVGISVANDKNLKKTITFTADVMVNDVLIKKGEYDIKFDAKAMEVSIAKKGEVVLTTKATVEMRAENARYNSASFKSTNKGQLLESLTFAGDRRAIVLKEMADSIGDGQ